MPSIARRLVPVGIAFAGVLTLIAVALGAQVSQYGGTTSQKLGASPFRITLAVGRGAVSNVQLTATVQTGGSNCGVNTAGTSYVFSKGKAKITRKKFNGKLTDVHGDSMTIKGRVTSKSMTGSFIIDAPSVAGGTQTCNSGNVKFTARAAGGQVDHTEYSGEIGPGDPINFRVSANGKAVDGLVLHYAFTVCPGAGNTAPAYHFKTLAIRSGSFTGTSTDHFGPSDMATIRITGTFFGRVATGNVSGTQRITGVPPCNQSENFTAKAK